LSFAPRSHHPALVSDTEAPSSGSPRPLVTRHPPPVKPSPVSLAASTVFNMQSQSGLSKRQAKKHDTEDRQQSARERFVETQR
jgi:hypothetical protein